MPTELAELMYRADKHGRQRILRSVYECGVFQALREKLRCKGNLGGRGGQVAQPR